MAVGTLRLQLGFHCTNISSPSLTVAAHLAGPSKFALQFFVFLPQPLNLCASLAPLLQNVVKPRFQTRNALGLFRRAIQFFPQAVPGSGQLEQVLPHFSHGSLFQHGALNRCASGDLSFLQALAKRILSCHCSGQLFRKLRGACCFIVGELLGGLLRFFRSNHCLLRLLQLRSRHRQLCTELRVMPLQTSQGGLRRCLCKTSLMKLMGSSLSPCIGQSLQTLNLTLVVQLSLGKVILQ
mmetsp:Transcript_30199/g.72417  ORF Transcript_30199/g.72417 Transcript_30199/m.72417 type:complete len:238 (-) Transcript_30199:75-788(-)